MSKVQRLTRIALVAALYFALTMALPFLAYEAVQFRISEMLMLLCFYRKDYCFSLILGCALSNLFSPLGYIDVLFGTVATVSACVGMRLSKNLWVASLFPTLMCVFVAAELYLYAAEPFWIAYGTVAAGEFVVVTLAGCPVFKMLEKNTAFMSLIGADEARVHADCFFINKRKPPKDGGL